MKRLITFGLLALVLLLSLLGISLAIYVKDISLYQNGWMGPKYFAFQADGTGQQKSIQPGGSVSYTLQVSNYDSGGTAQVPLHTAFSITFPTSLCGTGKLRAQLYSGSTLLNTSETGTLECNGNTLPAATQRSDTYTLKLTWLNADLILLAGLKSTPIDPSHITVRVSGYQ